MSGLLEKAGNRMPSSPSSLLDGPACGIRCRIRFRFGCPALAPDPDADQQDPETETAQADAREDPVDRLDVVADEEAEQRQSRGPDEHRRDGVGEERPWPDGRRAGDERDENGGT